MATVQTMSIVVNLHDSRAVFQVFITVLRFSFVSPSYQLSEVQTKLSISDHSCQSPHPILQYYVITVTCH